MLRTTIIALAATFAVVGAPATASADGLFTKGKAAHSTILKKRSLFGLQTRSKRRGVKRSRRSFDPINRSKGLSDFDRYHRYGGRRGVYKNLNPENFHG